MPPGGAGVITRHYFADRQGNVLAVANASGTLHQRFFYTPFGVELTGDASGNPFRYTGQRHDPETGLYYYRARYYDADLGRFLSTDPIGYADQWNLYAYVHNDPLNLTDPSGMQTVVKIYDPNQAIGQGHVSVAFVDREGNVTAYEFTGEGELREFVFEGGELQVAVDRNGDLTIEGAVTLGRTMHGLSAGARDNGVNAFNMTVFRGAENEAGFNGAAAALRNQIEANGGPSVGFPIGDGPTYRLLTCNCGDVANSLAAAGGAQGFSNHIRPNSQFRRERDSEIRGSNHMWTISVVGGNYTTQSRRQ